MIEHPLLGRPMGADVCKGQGPLQSILTNKEEVFGNTVTLFDLFIIPRVIHEYCLQ